MSQEEIGTKKVKDIQKGDKNIDITIILIQSNGKTKLKNDKQITHFLVADETGSIQCNFFDEAGKILQEGDIVFLKGAYASLFKGHLTLYTPKQGFGYIEKIGEFFMSFLEKPNLSEKFYEDNNEEYEKKPERVKYRKKD